MTTIITEKEFALKITGRQYPFGMTVKEVDMAKEHGLVVVYGVSDDIVRLRGAIEDELDCYNGGVIYLDPDKKDLLRNICDNADCPHYKKIIEKAPYINAVWNQNGFSWIYYTKIPHATFKIKEKDDYYCRGIVFNISNIQ